MTNLLSSQQQQACRDRVDFQKREEEQEAQQMIKRKEDIESKKKDEELKVRIVGEKEREDPLKEREEKRPCAQSKDAHICTCKNNHSFH